MEEQSGKNVRSVKHIAWLISAILVAVAAALILVYIVGAGSSITVHLEDYTTVGRNALGVPTAVLDIDAILTELMLPNPKNPRVDMNDYPDVKALCSMTIELDYTDREELMRVRINCDTKELARYGIIIGSTTWDQPIKGYVVDGVTPTPVPIPEGTPLAPTPVPTEQQESFLYALYDENGNGYNLRKVCESVQHERDLLCVELFGNNYNTEKTQTYFIVNEQESSFINLYRAVYSVTEVTEGTEEAQQLYFAIDVYNLRLTDGAVDYAYLDVSLYDTQDDAEGVSRFIRTGCEVTKLYGGGAIVQGKNAYDQNGFIRFAGQATSYRMPNGVYWSPSHELLSEDMIWSLTAVEGHSLANILRYARKEIYARYYVAFDYKTEREFVEHYGSYGWYEARDDDLSKLMTEAELANIALLREIQTLIER